MSVLFKKLNPEATIPTRATPNSAGFDLYALCETTIDSNGSYLVPTGVAVQLPPGTYGRIAMRSGLAVKQHLAVSAGVIDVDYAGDVGVVVFMTGAEPHSTRQYTIKKGERFAQLIPEMVSYAPGIEVDEFPVKYGEHAGFGSTGEMKK